MNTTTSKISSSTKPTQSAKQEPNQTQDVFLGSGNVRPGQAAKYLSIGLSTLWLYVKQGRIQKPLKLSTRISCFPAAYIRELAANGIPDAPQANDAEVSK